MTTPPDAIRVGIAFDFDAETLAGFRSLSPRLDLRINPARDQASIDEVAATDLDGLIAHRLPTDRSRTPSLRWLQVPSAGVEVVLGDGADGRPGSC